MKLRYTFWVPDEMKFKTKKLRGSTKETCNTLTQSSSALMPSRVVNFWWSLGWKMLTSSPQPERTRAAKKPQHGTNRAEILADNQFGSGAAVCQGQNQNETLSLTCEPFPNLSSAFPKKRGRYEALIGWEGNTPSCCHSVINSRSPHKKNTCKRYESLSCSQKSGGLMSISKLKAVKLRVEEKTATVYNNPTAELTNESLKLNNLLCPCLALEWHEGNAHTASRRK